MKPIAVTDEAVCAHCKHKERDFHELPCRVCGREKRNFEKEEEGEDEDA
jgi:rubredoxin